MHHSPGFLKWTDDARSRIREISIDQARACLLQNPKVMLLDVRNIEKTIPDVRLCALTMIDTGFRLF